MDPLGDIVIIAGANGSGKTRLKQALLDTFQGRPSASLTIEATRKKETQRFSGQEIKVEQGQQNPALNDYMTSRRFGRGRYVGSLVQVDSDRTIKGTAYPKIELSVSDPDEQATPSNFYWSDFSYRWTDFVSYIHEKVAAHTNQLAKEVKKGGGTTFDEANEKYPNPLDKYKKVFSQLLPGKELQDINPAIVGEFTYTTTSSTDPLQFNTLSSGEQEVCKVVFDMVRKEIKHSVIIVDEPELHLHPTLAFKLVETLKSIGDHTNQFIFLTHSADLISTYYSTGDVYFLDNEPSGNNQAHRLSDLNRSHNEIIKAIGDNLGLFAVGKKLILVEGEDSSIDKLTYHLIAQRYLPEAKIVSVGSVENITALRSFEEQIRNSVFGINFYMIRDRDGLTDEQVRSLEENGRLRCIKKRQLENYFLDETVLLKVAQHLYVPEAHNPPSSNSALTLGAVSDKLKELAKEAIKLSLLNATKDYITVNYRVKTPTIKSVESLEVDGINESITSDLNGEIKRLASLNPKVSTFINNQMERLKASLADNTWKDIFDGKYIFNRFCSDYLKTPSNRVRRAYVDIALKDNPAIFVDIRNILKSFQ